MSRRPVIGICASLEDARWGPWHQLTILLPHVYTAGVQRAGGIALLLPPDEHVVREPDELLDAIDGLVLAGGRDIEAATYGAESHPSTADPCPERDLFELALTRRAVERDLPVLGICRGCQLLNVALGGSLEQHLPDVLGHEEHSPAPDVFSDHDVRLAPGSVAGRAAGEVDLPVKSHHHQGLGRLGEGLEATGWAEPDGIVEAVERSDRRFVVGMLFHPEEDPESRVLASFVAHARAARDEPAQPERQVA